MRHLRILVCIIFCSALTRADESSAVVLESDSPALLAAFKKIVRNKGSTIAVKNSTMVQLPMREGDFSCEQTGEFGSMGGYKFRGPSEAGDTAKAEDASVLSGATHMIIARGCRACILNEIPGTVAVKPLRDSEKERLANWRFLPCSELLDKLRGVGLAESSVVRFAERLDLSPQGVPIQRVRSGSK